MSHELLAYIDPGSGTLLVQALIAAICGGALFFRGAIVRLLSPFVRRGAKRLPPRR